MGVIHDNANAFSSIRARGGRDLYRIGCRRSDIRRGQRRRRWWTNDLPHGRYRNDANSLFAIRVQPRQQGRLCRPACSTWLERGVEKLDGITGQGRLDCADNRLFEPIGRLLSVSVGRGGIAASTIQLKEEIDMVNRRILLSLGLFTSIVLAGGTALAKNQHHNNGHNLLGAKVNQNGKHEIGKIGNNAVTAEVNNKKVVNMSAANLPARKVKSNKRMD